MTEHLCDAVIAIGHYSQDGRTKTRNINLGKVMMSNGRLWLAIQPHLLNPVVAGDNRRTTKALGIGDGQECSASFLRKDGQPWRGPDNSTAAGGSEPPKTSDDIEDGIDF